MSEIILNLLKKQIPDLIINGSIKHRLPNNLNLTIPGIQGKLLPRALRPLITCSSGAACSNGKPSHVLRAIGRTKQEAEASLRISLGRTTTIEHVNRAAYLITEVVNNLRQR